MGVRDSGVRLTEARSARTRENDGVERLDGRDKRERVSDHAAHEVRSTGCIRGYPMHDTRNRDHKQSRAAQDCRAASARRVLASAAGPTSGIDCTGTPRVLPAPGRQTLSWLQPARKDYTERAKDGVASPPSRASACSAFSKGDGVRTYVHVHTHMHSHTLSFSRTYIHTHTRYPVHVVKGTR